MPSRLDRRLTGFVFALALVAALAACGGKRPPVLATTPGEGAAPPTAEAAAPAQPLDEGPDVRPVGGDEAAAGVDIPGDALGAGEASPLFGAVVREVSRVSSLPRIALEVDSSAFFVTCSCLQIEAAAVSRAPFSHGARRSREDDTGNAASRA